MIFSICIYSPCIAILFLHICWMRLRGYSSNIKSMSSMSSVVKHFSMISSSGLHQMTVHRMTRMHSLKLAPSIDDCVLNFCVLEYLVSF